MLFLSRSQMLMCSAAEINTFIEEDQLEAPCLTFAAEVLGQRDDEARFWPTLVLLLGHKEAYIREGAVYGLGCYTTVPEAKAWLEKIVVEDEEAGIREAAKDMLLAFPPIPRRGQSHEN